MATPIRKATTAAAAASSNGDRRFPPEAYDYNDDVSAERVDAVRKKAAKQMAADQWDVVDGFDFKGFAAS